MAALAGLSGPGDDEVKTNRGSSGRSVTGAGDIMLSAKKKPLRKAERMQASNTFETRRLSDAGALTHFQVSTRDVRTTEK